MFCRRIISCFLSVVIILSSMSMHLIAYATLEDASMYGLETLIKWISGTSDEPLGGWKLTEWADALFSSNKEQKYYTTPTSSEEDQYGNVINYYRGGDTTTTKIIDSYNRTFNTIHNTSNTTNNYKANVKLSDFLNSYATYNQDYTYNTSFKSWYYDNTSNTYNYDASQTYYNTDNNQYYISIDNSTDEYYLVDVKYSPTFVTVNYNYYNTDNSTNYGDVTNIYYFELTDGRNSSTLTADEVGGLALGYDVTNYQLISDDPNTLSLQHFDGDYTDSSSFSREFYSANRSTQYVDTGVFGKAVRLAGAVSGGPEVGVVIDELSNLSTWQIDFRIATDSRFSVYVGNQAVIRTEYAYYYYASGNWTLYDSLFGATYYFCGPGDFAESGGGILGPFSNYKTYQPFLGKVTDVVSINRFDSYRISFVNGTLYYFRNGDLIGSYTGFSTAGSIIKIVPVGTMYLDELRVTTGDMVSTGSYTPSSEPFDTNKVLALPNELAANTIYVRHSTPANGWRIGGVRPSNPVTGFFYLPLHADYTGGQSQLYDGSNWVDVEAMVYDGSEIHSVIGYTFTPVSESPDVDSDLEPGRPPDPGEDVDQSTCTHTWEEASRTEPTCVLAGSVAYTCSKCGAKKTESIAKLGHTWEVKTSIPTTYDEEGNVVTQGYTIYKCSVCDEEYKDTDGTGPPVVESPDDSDGGGWFSELLKKIGEFFGTTIGALLELVGTIISKVLDSLITLVTNTVAKLTEVVTLFGSFSESMGTLWGWLPPEIVSVLVAGVTIIVFAAIIRLFFR